MCICGPLDMAKIELLTHNMKYIGLLYSVLSGFQAAIDSLFLDEILETFLDKSYFTDKTHFYVINFVNIGATVLSMIALVGLLRKEMKELKTFTLVRRRTHSSDYMLFG